MKDSFDVSDILEAPGPVLGREACSCISTDTEHTLGSDTHRPRAAGPSPSCLPGGAWVLPGVFSKAGGQFLGHTEIICKLKSVFEFSTGYDFRLLSTLAFGQHVMYSPFQDSR